MAEIRHFPGFQATWDSVARKVAPGDQPAPNGEKYCVYNQTRGRFVATSVEAVDASSGGQEARLRNLELGTGAGLWLFPCPEISPTSIRFLVDLVYLNREGAVLAAVESFPLVKAAVSSIMAGSALVLAEGTVAAGEVHIGDRLIVAIPDEMKRHLQTLKEAKAAAQGAASPSFEQPPPSSPESHSTGHSETPESAHLMVEPYGVAQTPSAPLASIPAQPYRASDKIESPPVARSAAVEPSRADPAWATSGATPATPIPPAFAPPATNVWPQEHFSARTPRSAFESLPNAVQQGAPAYEPLPATPAPMHSAIPEVQRVEPPARQQPAPAQVAGAEPWKKRVQAKGKGWFAKLLGSEPEDPRVTSRESLPDLIAYYFTGGTPKPHAVRDISPTGMYILTEERWYPGTVVRVTLTDRHNPTTERSITVNAKAVRAASDGVGFEFVLEERDRSKIRPEEWMDRANGMYFDQVQEFLRVYKTN